MANKLKVLRRSSRDIARRSLAGIFIYPLFWPIIAYGSGFHNSHPNIVISLVILHIVISAARLSHTYAIDKIPDETLSAWMKMSYILLFTQVFAWGAMFGFSMLESNEQFQFYMTLSTAGIAAGGTNTFAPNKALSRGFSIFAFAPAVIVAVFQQEYIMVMILSAYLIYIFGLAHNQYKEYWHSIDNEMELERLSLTDALTQLENRRSFDKKLMQACQVSARNSQPIAILLMDIDHFKQVNDEHGHDVGDICLQHVANIIKQSMPRVTDSCARYGGEEFAAILPDTNLEGAEVVAEKIRTNIADNPAYHENSKIQMTVSIGITSKQVNKSDEEIQKVLLKEADIALYQAKDNGRNQYALYVEQNAVSQR